MDESLTGMALLIVLDIATVFFASSKVDRKFNLARYIFNPKRQDLLNSYWHKFKLNTSHSMKLYLKKDV